MDALDRRLPLYSYLRPLIEGRRVLELGTGEGRGAEHLVSLGATGVVSVDLDVGRAGSAKRGRTLPPSSSQVTFVASLRVLEESHAGDRFDVIVVPDATALVRPGAAVNPAALGRWLTPSGHLVCAAESSDRRDARGGVGYYDLHDALVGSFASVRMFGQTPFAAVGIAEFEAAAGGLRVDSGLIDPEAEEPSHYVGIAGAEPGPALGYGLVQVPTSTLVGGKPPRALSPEELVGIAVGAAGGTTKPAAGEGVSDAEVRELRRRAVDAEGRADGLERVQRAQAEELEELRARLRRAAEARAELDEEVTRLRRALTEADESVLNLTRRTTEEMTALAQRLTAGLRPVEAGASPELGAVLERLKDRETTLARRESELAERDERIAALEAEKQDLAWRAAEAEEAVRTADARALELARGLESLRAGARPAGEPDVAVARERDEDEELVRTLEARERTLEEFRRAAAAHVDEIGRLRMALAEQESLVIELEEELRTTAEARKTAEHEAERARRALVESEESDRGRRSRLAELEGTLLRLQREKAANAERALAAPRPDGAQLAAAETRVRELELRLAEAEARLKEAIEAQRRARELEARLAALESSLTEEAEGREEAERRWHETIDQMVGLEQQQQLERRELALDRDALRAKLEALEQAGSSPAALRVAEQDVVRLRAALEKSEEALHQARAQIFPLRGRIATLEQSLAAREAAERSLVARLSDELLALEAGLRAEAGALAEVDAVLAELGRAEGRSESRGQDGSVLEGSGT